MHEPMGQGGIKLAQIGMQQYARQKLNNEKLKQAAL